MDFKFTSDWFSNNIINWKNFLSQYKDRPCQMLEIGSYEGRSAIWACDNILTHPQSHIDCIDIFSGNYFENFKHNTAHLDKKLTWYQGNSIDVLQTSPFTEKRNCYDIIYVDGSHTKEDVAMDAFLTFPMLKNDGILIFDDYTGGAKVKEGVEEFFKTYGGKFNTIMSAYQLYLKKVSD